MSYPWIYAPLYRFVQTTSQPSVTAVRDFLRRLEQGKYVTQVNLISDSQLERWIRSALTAIHHLHNKVHYVVGRVEGRKLHENQTSEIEIIDHGHTEQRQEGCQWKDGLHQFLQVKERLDVTVETMTAGSIDHANFFKLYRWIFGLSGTVGQRIERNELFEVYNVDCYDIPPHFPSKRRTLPVRFVQNEAAHFALIYEHLTTIKHAEQPALVLMKDIEETEKFARYLHQKQCPHQLLNDTQRDSTDYIIAHAGFPGVITVATDFAGRGTDFVLTHQALRAGGLFQITTSYATNIRVQRQRDGRAARQGQEGTIVSILSLDDPFFTSLPHELTAVFTRNLIDEAFSEDISSKTIAFMDDIRTQRIAALSTERIRHASIAAIPAQKQAHFFQANNAVDRLFQDKGFQARTIEFLMQIKPQDLDCIEGEPSQRMKPLSKHVSELTVAGARNLLTQFKHAYQQDILYLWANFNDLLRDIDVCSEKIIETAFQTVWSSLQPYVDSPEENIRLWLMKLVKASALEIKCSEKSLIASML